MATIIKRQTSNTRTAARGPGFSFQYKPRTAEQVRERAQRALGGRDGLWKPEVKTFTAKEGENTIRILPPPATVDWGHYGWAFSSHYDIGVDGSAYLCAAKIKGEPCPICEERQRANTAGEEELSKSLRDRQNVAMWVIDRKDIRAGVQLWVISQTRDQSILKLCIDPANGEVLLVDHPEEGYDFSFIREGTRLNTKYKAEQFSRRSSPLSDDPKLAGAWLQYVTENPIDQMAVWHEYEYISNVLNGTPTAAGAGENTDGGDPVEQPAQQSAKPAIQRRTLIGKPAASIAPQPPQETAQGAEDLPTWDDLAGMNEDALAGLIEAFGLNPEADPAVKDGFGSADLPFEEHLREWIADQLGVEKPASAEPEQPEQSAAAAAPAANWRDKLKKLQGKK